MKKRQIYSKIRGREILGGAKIKGAKTEGANFNGNKVFSGLQYTRGILRDKSVYLIILATKIAQISVVY